MDCFPCVQWHAFGKITSVVHKKDVEISIFPQIAIAIRVLTSNRGEGDEPLGGLDVAPGCQGAVDVVPLLGAIVGCHCSVLWLRGRVTTNFGGVEVVPLLGAILLCFGCGGGDVVPLRAIAGCLCSVLGKWKVTANFGGGAIPAAIVVCYGWVTTNFGGSGRGATIAGCQFLFHIFLLYSGPPVSPKHPRK